MIGKFCAAAAVLVLSAGSAWASSCIEPIAPVAVDGSKATQQQMQDAVSDFKAFQVASDDYQSCLVAELNAQKREAAKAKDPKPVDPAIIKDVSVRIESNQRMKEKVGGELNAAILQYKAKHPKG